MDFDSLFSGLSFLAVIIYMYFGMYAYSQNTRSIIHKVFLMLCISYAIWSFAYAFAYVSIDNYTFSFWNKISAIGWCTFSAFILYLVLLITDKDFVKKKFTAVIIFFPALLFLFMAVFLFGADIKTPVFVSDFFYTGNFIYNFCYELIGIIILFLWGEKTTNRRIKKQVNIIVLTSITPFLLNLITQSILPIIGFAKFPHMGQLYSLILMAGLYRVITKYKFFKIPEKIIIENVTDTILDMIIILNEKGDFIEISRNTLDMLGYEKDELLKHNFKCILEEDLANKFSNLDINQLDRKYEDVFILRKNGERIPVNISCIPIYDQVINDFLGAALVMQDIRIIHELQRKNHELEQRAIRDSLTNLYNHQYSIEQIKIEVNKFMSENGAEPLSIVMLDIDYFKRVNDEYGHQFGDYVIKTIAGFLMDSEQSSGYAGRFGGEEFILILPGTDLDKACLISDNIRRQVEDFKFDKDLVITVSLGVKAYGGESPSEFVKHCDDLLYKAKQNGRNRVEGG